jgi:uncharacterized protein (TIGR03435 family)
LGLSSRREGPFAFTLRWFYAMSSFPKGQYGAMTHTLARRSASRRAESHYLSSHSILVQQAGSCPADADDTGENVFSALEQQLEVKLESTKGTHECVVVDRVERPNTGR